MGRSIVAAIPLTFKLHERFGGVRLDDFSVGFLDNFNATDGGAKIIKSDLLLHNYMPLTLLKNLSKCLLGVLVITVCRSSMIQK